MKYAVIFANKADDDYHLTHISPKDYCFIVEGNCVESAYCNWKKPKDYKKDWLLVAVTQIEHVREYAAQNDGIPLQIRLQCCRKKDLSPEECYMLGLEYEAN